MPPIHLPRPNNQTEQTSYTLHDTPSPHLQKEKRKKKTLHTYRRLGLMFSPSFFCFLAFAVHFGSHIYPNPFEMLYQTISASGCWGSSSMYRATYIISQVHRVSSFFYISILPSLWIIRRSALPRSIWSIFIIHHAEGKRRQQLASNHFRKCYSFRGYVCSVSEKGRAFYQCFSTVN